VERGAKPLHFFGCSVGTIEGRFRDDDRDDRHDERDERKHELRDGRPQAYRYPALCRWARIVSRPVRYKSVISTTNGMSERRSALPPEYTGLALENASIPLFRSTSHFHETPAMKAMMIPAIAPPAM